MSNNIASSISEELKNYNGELKPVNFYLPHKLDISITKFQSIYHESTRSIVNKETVFSQALQNFIVKATTLIESEGDTIGQMFAEGICMQNERESEPHNKKKKTFRIPHRLFLDLNKFMYLYLEHTHTELNGTTIYIQALQSFFSNYLTETPQDEGINKEIENLIVEETYELRTESAILTIKPPKYTDADFLREVYTTADALEEMKHLLRRKKNIILQGAPGVGKTFSAKRLAYVMMGEKNDSNIALVQFHQNYSYEDFIMGYKPEGGDFVLKEGVFFRFCRKALSDPAHDYFFIIDEINRGNMSKIFGELLMLIEKDYRGTYATLPYREERFTVPKNVYLIGMMNTADRSLAMIDYALRRRFSFVEMKPGFDSKGFRAYQQELNSELFDRFVELIKQLNDAICDDDTLGAGFQIGHSYLCGIIPEECDEAQLKEIVKYDILPTLSEYWFDDTDKAEDWAKKFNNLFA